MAGSYRDVGDLLVSPDVVSGTGGGARGANSSGTSGGGAPASPATPDRAQTRQDIGGLIMGTSGATAGTGDLVPIITGGQFSNQDAFNASAQHNIGAAYDFLGGQNLAAQFAAQQNNMLAQQALQAEGFNMSRGHLTANADLAQRGIGIDREELGVNAGAANRDIDSVMKLLGLNDRSLARQLASVDRYGRINDKSLTNQMAGIAQQADVARRNLTDDSVARGAYNAPGTRRGMTDIEKEAYLAREGARIGFYSQQQGLTDREGAARESHEGTAINLNDRLGGAKDTLAKLDLAGKRLNLSAEQITTSLEQGLERLGLQELTSFQDLMTRLQSSDIEQQTMAANLLAQAAQIAGLDLFNEQTTPTAPKIEASSLHGR